MFNNKFKIIGGVLASFFAIFLIFFFIKGSNKKKAEPVTINYWGYQDEEEDIKPLLDEYKKSKPKVTINYKIIKAHSAEEYAKILNDALASGEAPDIFQVRNDWIPKDYKKMAPAPSSVFSTQNFADTFYEIANKELIYNNEIYAVPFYIDTLAIFYNEDLASVLQWPPSPGDKWEDTVAASKKLRSIEGNFIERAAIALGTSNNITNAQNILYLLMLQNNTEMVSNDLKTAYFNLSAKDKDKNIVYPGTSALDFYTSFSDPTKETYTWRQEMKKDFESFIDGKTVMTVGYAADLNKIKKETNDKINIEVYKIPQISNYKANISSYWANTVSKNSNNQKEAWDFLKFASSKEHSKSYLANNKLPSARKDLGEEELNETLKLFISQIADAKPVFKPDWEKMDAIFKELINDVAINKQPSQAAIDSAAKKITELLQQYKEKNEN